MSDESGKVVGELVESDQRPFEGDISESENSLSNDFGRNSSLETDSDEIVLKYQNDNQYFCCLTRVTTRLNMGYNTIISETPGRG
jgi:hypothetical protein